MYFYKNVKTKTSSSGSFAEYADKWQDINNINQNPDEARINNYPLLFLNQNLLILFSPTKIFSSSTAAFC